MLMKNKVSLIFCIPIILLSSCQTKETQVQHSIQQLNQFTTQLLRKTKEKPDLITGIKDAQEYLTANKNNMRQHIELTKTTSRVQVSEKTMKAWQAAVTANLTKVETLKKVHIGQALQNEELAKQLNKLVKEYKDLLQK
ncbi:lipoprotein, putative [Microscilla marina ATCC 23134]|uniref:Lipoprotein, putative n=2 Tax=Microscilla marina TaxID=1027 RepID=A1ZMW8_MICM2|nr:lipoprotein, putative [Microscilla marina ATCC 23134]